MSNKRKPTAWGYYEKRVGKKRKGEEENKSGSKNVLNEIMVQRISSSASRRLKKYDPLDTRDFVPFSGFTELFISNIRKVCECFYNMPDNICDVLASNLGSSCSRIEQIKGKKVYFIRFKEDASYEECDK